jgi:hypothetical protein
MTEKQEQGIIVPEPIYLPNRNEILSRLKVEDGTGIWMRHGELDITFWRFPEIIAITSWERDASGYDDMYEGTWGRPHHIRMLSPDLNLCKNFNYELIHTEIPRERRFNTAINSYEEKAGQIFQRGDSLIVPITQSWFNPKDYDGVVRGRNGWLNQSLDRTEKKEIQFEIPEVLKKKAK